MQMIEVQVGAVILSMHHLFSAGIPRPFPSEGQRIRRSIFYQYQGRQEEAKQFYQKAVNADPDNPQSNKLFLAYLNDMGESPKATPYLARSNFIDSED